MARAVCLTQTDKQFAIKQENNLKYFLSILLLISSNAFAQNLPEPVSAAVGRAVSSSGKVDPTEVGYIGIRCGALYNSLAGYFEGNGNGAADQQTANQLKKQAADFNAVGIALSQATKKSSEALIQQATSLSQIYVEQMKKGKQLNNNALTPFIQADLASCKKEASGFTEMAAKTK